MKSRDDIGKLILRVLPSLTFFGGHGLGKLLGFAERAGKFADPFGLGSEVSLALMVLAEAICSIAVALGIFTRWATIPPIIGMSVALLWAHSGLIFGEGEKAYLYLVVYLAILVLGPGRLSLDHRMRRRA
ncbi:MAG: DoxX family protein [Thermoanaerobaculia bacterium]|nr:DoxX family protein [Thermoanaerobaculia bacterium]